MNKTAETGKQAQLILEPAQLVGRFTKRLTVAEGQSGVLLGADGQLRVLAPGTHRVLSWWERLGGKGAGFRAGLVPGGAFTAFFRACYLLSGDGELLDAALHGMARVVDPGLYFTRGMPGGGGAAAPGDLSSAVTAEALAVYVRRYTAADLIAGLPTRRLAGEMLDHLNGVLKNDGLALEDLSMLSFWRSDEEAQIAEKMAQIQTRLGALDLQQRLSSAATQEQYDAFMPALDPGLGVSWGLRPVAPAQPGPAAAGTRAGPGLRAALGGWAQPLKGPAAKLRWRLGRVFTAEPAPAPPAARRAEPRWWLPGMVYVAALALLGVGASWLTLDFGKMLPGQVVIGTLTTIWFFFLPAIIDMLRRMVEKREKIAHETWQLAGAARLEDVVSKDRVKTERFVRAQVRQDLQLCRDMVDDMVTRVYREGETAAALRMRDLRQKFDDALEKVGRDDFGKPAYLGEPRVGGMVFERMLDYEEELLSNSAVLAEKVNRMQRTAGPASDQAAGLGGLESHLDGLVFRFGGRARAIKA